MADSSNTGSGGKRVGRARALAGSLIGRSAELALDQARDSVRLMELASVLSQRTVQGSVTPALQAVLQVQRDLSGSLVGWVRGEQRLTDAGRDAWARLRAGSRYQSLVATWGRQLFGSARYPGEQTLVEDELLRLTFIPPAPQAPAQPVALFHAGGGIPYSDRVFRLLPEANLFDRFRERGVGVYAMELRGDRAEVDYSGLTIDRLIDAIERFSTVAFEHAAGRKLVLEGYCGHGMQAIAYVAAKPEDAERKFALLATFVSPIDGTECKELSEITQLTPESWLLASQLWWRWLGGYVPGDSMRTGMDLSLKTTFHKTPLGYFAAGWAQKAFGAARSIDELTPAQKRELAGAYWISPDNANRFPIPVDLARFATALFRQGIAKDGTLPWSYAGQPLSLQTLRGRTTLPVVGFYGGRDSMVPDRTAYVLLNVLGPRYRHVVHPQAGHVSYILSPRMWDPKDKRGLQPNPIDVLLAMTSASSAAPG